MDILIYYIFQLAFLYLIYRVVKFLVSAIYRSIKTSLRTVNEENKPSTPMVTIDDIVDYKEENGVVNAYFNQQALDVYLFERAKVKSNNFSTKEQWERERGKRAVKLEDLNNTDHAVWSYALSDNEFASEGNLILVIGLDHIMFSNYCYDNNISEVDTLLYCGVNIYSKYSGKITTYIRHRYIGRVDLKNKIQDGDLLFSIKLSTPTEKIVKPHESITFSYNLLSRDFLDAVPYITDITIGKCLVENNSYVNKGDDVLEVVEYTNSVFKYEPRYRTTIKSPYSGWIIFTNADLKYQYIKQKLQKGTPLFDIYQKGETIGETIEETIKDRHPNEISVSIDDIINYKEENGVVNAYFNQQALDVYLFERAKVKSNNFTTKEQWRTEQGKRAVKLEDLNNADHMVWSYALSDNEFASEGNLILVIGLDHIKFSSYCFRNNVSDVDTLLYCGVNIYSKHYGEITTYIRDKYIGSVNLRNKIQDGDLLFSIKLSTPTEKIVKPHESVTFSYNLLSRDFLDAVPYITDITLGKCLVENNSYVNKGDDVLEVIEFTNCEPRYRTTIKSPYSGLIVFTNDDLKYHYIKHKLMKGTSLFDIYKNEETIEETIKDKHPNEISVSIDSYTNITSISSKKCAGRSYGFRMENAYIAFENTAGKTYLLLRYDRKLLQLNKKCSLHLYLSDKTIITITPEVNPTRYNDSYFEARFYIPSEAMKKLEVTDFISCKITNAEGVTIYSGMNSCCQDENYSHGVTQKASYEVFQDFIVKFNNAVKEHIKEDEEVNTNISENAPCYVYLMMDTTNNFHKIGISNNPRYREHTLQSDKPTIELVCAKKYPTRIIAESIEKALHSAYSNKRIRGEWFNLDFSEINEIKETLK